jgi:soluble lytic murein transglycosylase
LNRQRGFLDGDIYAALAAYNGGPGNAAAWKELVPPDPDLFLEVIRFEETRNYIKGIYEIFTIYRDLYDRTL